MRLDQLFSPEDFAVLEARAEWASAPLLNDDEIDSVSVLMITINQEKYAIPLDQLTAVFQDIALTPVPCVPEFVAGIANVRGHIVSVLDLAVLLGLKSDGETPEGTVIVANSGNSAIGFRIGTIGEVVKLSLSQMDHVPPNANLAHAEYLRGVFSDGTILLNLTEILDDPRLIVDEAVN